MTIRTFWTIFIKILGLWLVRHCLDVIPQSFTTLLYLNGESSMLEAVYWFGIIAATTAIYLFVLWVFVFKTNWIIDKLKLDKNFTEERIDLNISSKTVLRIATLIIGGLILVESLPALCKQLFTFYQEKTIFRKYPGTGWIIFHLVKSIIGYVLLANNKNIVDRIDKQSNSNND